MSLYVYIADECLKEAQTQNHLEEVKKLRDRIERTQTTAYFDNFPPPYLKKRFERQIRLLADIRSFTVDDETHTVLVFLAVFVRGGTEYRAFLDNCREYGEKFLTPRVTDETVENYLKERLAKKPLPKKPEPSESESRYLYQPQGRNAAESDLFVCESEDWVSRVGEESMQPRLGSFFDAITPLIDSDVSVTEIAVRDYRILYRWLPRINKLFLAGIAETDEHVADLRKLYGAILAADNPDSLTDENILRWSARSYPALILADDNLWFDIQKDKEANLSLSPEETNVLESAHHADLGFPVFINGRAGSGKSTILYYLFADYVSLALELEQEKRGCGLPVLFSCSHDLRERATKTVANLIHCNPQWREESEKPKEKIPDQCFEEFHNYLLSLIPKEERGRFPAGKYIDYAQFRHLWQKQFHKVNPAKGDVGSDLSWHAIRTFIKGTNPEDYLEPEEYKHLPRRQRSVSDAAFSRIFENVWEPWYRPLHEEKGYWDDQDLARYVFSEGLVKPLYPAVFCDEAQDFTRVELELLFRLCLFSDRRLDYGAIQRVPYAFAGDPFQTLNPTGFRWDAIQASFHEKLTDILSDHVTKGCDLNYQDLNLNYRSTRNIVRLSNVVQALRAALFDIPSLRPQESWRHERDFPMPVLFNRNERASWAQLKNESDITIIIPCGINEEKEYLEANNDLKSIVRIDEESGVPLNVLSVARSKGLEFPRVVLFGFADAAPGNLIDLLDNPLTDPDQLLPYEYYVNQLYVGTSRPKRRLFIIDSPDGRDSLWQVANDEELLKKIFSRLPDGEATWKAFLGGYQIGNTQSWKEDRGDPEENAIRYEAQGRAQRDPYLLQSAALTYESLGKTTQALQCRALALKFEGKLIAAGRKFLQAGHSTEALELFWEAGLAASSDILQLPKADADMNRSIKYRLFHLHSDFSVQSFTSIVDELLDRSRENNTFVEQLNVGGTYESVMGALIDAALKDEGTPWKSIVPKLLEAVKSGLPIDRRRRGELHFRADQFREAVAAWESSGDSQKNPRYQVAKQNVLADDFHPKLSTLAPQDGELLMKYFLEHGPFHLAVPAARFSTRPDVVLDELFRRLGQRYHVGDRSDEIGLCEILKDLMQVLGNQGKWNLVADIGFAATGSELPKSLRDHKRFIENHSPSIVDAVVVACAGSDTFSQQPTQTIVRFADFFRKVGGNFAQWRNRLTLAVIGTAFERANRHKDILPFYERITVEGGFRLDDVAFAQKRWIAVKEKQVKREEQEGDETSARRHRKEAEEARKRLGLEGVKLPELPSFDTAWIIDLELAEPAARKEPESDGPDAAESETKGDASGEPPAVVEKADRTTPESAPARPTSLIVGDLRIDFSPANGKANITHTPSMDTASIRTSKARFSSEDVEVERNEKVFSVKAWGLTCDFTAFASTGEVRLEIPEARIGIELQFDRSAHDDETQALIDALDF